MFRFGHIMGSTADVPASEPPATPEAGRIVAKRAGRLAVCSAVKTRHYRLANPRVPHLTGDGRPLRDQYAIEFDTVRASCSAARRAHLRALRMKDRSKRAHDGSKCKWSPN